MIFTTKTGSTYLWDKELSTLQRVQVGVNAEDLGIEGVVMEISSVDPEPVVGIRPTFWFPMDKKGRQEYLITSEVRSIADA